MDARTAYHLALNYKERSRDIAADLKYWGNHMPAYHREKLEKIRYTYEVMKSEMRRACADGTTAIPNDHEQILIYLGVIDS